ncbi:MAG: hypothetical protein WCP12_16960 [bacterium]
MTEQTTKPGAKVAWVITIAATFDLFAFVMLVKGNVSLLLLSVFGVCSVSLILLAVYAWKSYFENLIAHKS